MKAITDRNLTMWEAGLREHSRLVFTICYSMTGDYFEAEDLAQETFLSAFRHMEKFDGQNMKAWLARIAANKCRDYLKNASRRSLPSPEEGFYDLADPEPSPEEAFLQKDVDEKLQLLCHRLKEPYRSVALAHFAQGRDPREIAQATGKNLKTVQTQIYRARGMLARLWKEEFR